MATFKALVPFQHRGVFYKVDSPAPYELDNAELINKWVDIGLIVVVVADDATETVPTYENGHLVKIEELEDGVVIKRVSYTYNANDEISTHTEETKARTIVSTYNYDGQGELSSITKETLGGGL